jgi:uncharacterized protein YkwD
MRFLTTFRTFMVLGLGLSIAGAGMQVIQRPLPSPVMTTVEASAPKLATGIPEPSETTDVTGLPPERTLAAPGASDSMARVKIAPSAAASGPEPQRASPIASAGQILSLRAAEPVASLPSAATVAVPGIYSPEKAAELIALMNEARVAAGLPPMATDSLLTTVAGVRAEDLAEREYFDHYSPDGSSAFSELSARGVNYGLAGENLARNNFPDAESLGIAFDALMASEGHRANILEPRFTRVGVAALLDGDLWIYVMVYMD